MSSRDRKNLQDFGSILDEKRALRSELLRQRNDLSVEIRAYWDRKLRERFLALRQVTEANLIYCYISYGSEIDTRLLMEKLIKHGKRIAVPRVVGREMVFCEIRGMKDTIAGFKGIPEPAQYCREVHDPHALMLMPGLAFTQAGDRMGYGGGFYDRFLEKEPEHQTVALAYPFQLLKTIPVESNDRRIQGIVLPDRIIRC